MSMSHHPYAEHLARLGLTEWVPRWVAAQETAESLPAMEVCVVGVQSLGALPFGHNLMAQLQRVWPGTFSFSTSLDQPGHCLVLYDDQRLELPEALSSLEALLHHPDEKKRLWSWLAAASSNL